MAEWSLADEQQLQTLIARKVFVSQNEGTMADSSKRRHDGSPTGESETPWIELADAVQYPEPLTQWCVIVGNVGKNEVRFWKV